MKSHVRSACVLGALIICSPLPPALAQGVSSAAVAGRLTDEAGAAVASALVSLVNGSTGQRYARRSGDDGRYNFENVAVGGPYTLEVRALSFEPLKSEAFQLALGQRSEVRLTLKRAAVEVAAVTITAEADPLLSAGRTGAQTLISDSALRRLPTLNRSFDNFLSATPQVVGRSFTGQNDRFNNIQIDGTVNNDLFNLGASNGSPGGGVNARPLSLEAIKEYQVLIAPFDVRQGGFVGGLVNAITKSGTNAFHGSAFGYGQNQNFVGTDTAGVSVPVSDFQQQQYGFTVGGPIIRDRLHFFVSGDLRHDNRPFASSVQIGPDPSNPVDTAGAERFSHANILDQRVVEATANLTFSLGRHLFILGTHNEFIHFRNVFFPASIGIWSFASPAALAAGTPNMYARALPGLKRPDGPVADFKVTQVGFYGEDSVSPVSNLTVTLGLRLDVPSLPAPAQNNALTIPVFRAVPGATVNTSSTPSGNILWSPRLGFNYDVNGRQEMVFRGGAGVFSGRPPYVWVANAYGNTGLEQQTLFCDGAASGGSTDTVPAFT